MLDIILCIFFLLFGILTGIIIHQKHMKRTYRDPIGSIFIIDQADEPPQMFLELNRADALDGLEDGDFVYFPVVRKNHGLYNE